MKIENANHIHASLRAQGLTSRSWAIEHGYHPRTVLDSIRMFAPCMKRKPKRPLSRQIIADLSATIDFDLLGVVDDE
jgi:gp16 family phage-associated protein